MRVANRYFKEHIAENILKILNKIISKKPSRYSENVNDLSAANFSFITKDTFYLLFRLSYLYPKVL